MHLYPLEVSVRQNHDLSGHKVSWRHCTARIQRGEPHRSKGRHDLTSTLQRLKFKIHVHLLTYYTHLGTLVLSTSYTHIPVSQDA